nr:MAG TPA: hypothetical protein [Caudoviricetes sp.]
MSFSHIVCKFRRVEYNAIVLTIPFRVCTSARNTSFIIYT